MIKTTINKRDTFAKNKTKRIARSTCYSAAIARGGLVLENYKIIASGSCSEERIGPMNNLSIFKKQQQRQQKEVA